MTASPCRVLTGLTVRVVCFDRVNAITLVHGGSHILKMASFTRRRIAARPSYAVMADVRGRAISERRGGDIDGARARDVYVRGRHPGCVANFYSVERGALLFAGEKYKFRLVERT